MPPDVTPTDLPFDEAVRWFSGKGYAMSPDGWRDVWRDANARAFTVARVTQMDVLQDVRNELQKALDSGMTRDQFRKNLIPILTRKGWFAPKGEDAEVEMPDGTIRKRLTGWRLDNIFHTNMQGAYAVGRYQQMKTVADRRPYWQYHAILDASTRPAHAAQDGKVYHHQHPFWGLWYPPNGFSCRCYPTSLSERQLQARGLRVQERIPADRPDEGFDYNPGEVGINGGWQPDFQKFDPELLEKSRIAQSPEPKFKMNNRADMVQVIKDRLGTFTDNGIKQIDFGKHPFIMSTDCAGRITVSTSTFPAQDGLNPAKDLLRAFKKISSGDALTFNEEYSLESLWHEINHNRQMWGFGKRTRRQDEVMETINQWVSRRTYPDLMRALGTEPAHQEAIIASGYGYKTLVKRFDRLLAKLGIDGAQILDDLMALHRDFDANAYIDPLAEIISKHTGYAVHRSHIAGILSNLAAADRDFDGLLRRW